ncbi:plasmid mobilization relaxosome protein MobC [Paenibacillus athensensis]|uniref:Mobilization protein n=2 Tax=Paenibacillus athensensis TaxID=1967502 RepID=A0A4Y8PZW4_9BACL|nr:plasmid mobilization relaxosome protein MobC [Paenibacillus athensensis]
MRRRPIRIQVWVNADENARLQASSKKSGLSQEGYIRSLINGYLPKTMPPPDYYAMMRQLYAIGNNLNQLAAKAHATGHLDRMMFQQEADQLRRAIQDIQQAVTSPERIAKPNSTNPEAHPP